MTSAEVGKSGDQFASRNNSAPAHIYLANGSGGNGCARAPGGSMA